MTQVAEAQARLEHNRRYVAFLQHQIDIKEARAARQKAQEDEVILSHLCPVNHSDITSTGTLLKLDFGGVRRMPIAS